MAVAHSVLLRRSIRETGEARYPEQDLRPRGWTAGMSTHTLWS